VHAHGSPVANNVVEKEARRFVGLHRMIEVTIEDFLPNGPVGACLRCRHGLENEQHAPRQVAVVVLVESDLIYQLLAEHGAAKYALLARRPIKHLLDGADCRLDQEPSSSLDEHHEVVVAARSELAPPPGAHEDYRV